MVGASGQVATFQVHLGNFTRALEDALMVQLHAAAAEWVKAVLLKIPIYTGTAKGTFAPLSRVLKKFNVSNPYVGPVSNMAAQKIRYGFHYGGRTWALGYYAGMNYTTHNFTLEGSGTTARTLRFIYTNELPYILWNDMYPAPPWMILPSNPPWEAYQAGADAFEKYCLNEIPKKLPSVAGLITVQIVRIR